MLAVNVIKRLLNFKRLNQLNDQFSDRPLERVREAINLAGSCIDAAPMSRTAASLLPWSGKHN